MEPTLQALLAASAGFFVVMVLLAAVCAVHKANHQRFSLPTRSLNQPPPAELSSTFDSSLNSISMHALLTATRNFSPDLIIGDGSFGLVYKARLPDVTVAVKKLSPDAFQGFREFRAETDTLSKLRHPNIVRILGYCVTGSDRVLIYEYVEKGSLDQWLLDPTYENAADGSWLPLSWETRVNIIRGVACGLAYMHNLDKAIIHRDIKASNVLLDREFVPHIADFGLARRIEGSHSHVSTQVAGTMGYMPPEYIQGAAMATPLGDVYSFGILMLEISTGIRPNVPFKAMEEEGEGDGKEVRLVEWAKKKVAQGRHMEILDANISREGLKESSVFEFLQIAILCTSDSYKDRPPMKEVEEMLNRIST